MLSSAGFSAKSFDIKNIKSSIIPEIDDKLQNNMFGYFERS